MRTDHMQEQMNAVLRGSLSGEAIFHFIQGNRMSIVKRGEQMIGGVDAVIPRSAVADGLGKFADLSARAVPTQAKLRVPHAPFLWMSHGCGELMSVSSMASNHVYFALRMSYNHSVAPAFRVGDFKRYDDVASWSAEYRAQAVREFATELSRRDDLDANLAYELADMAANVRVILALNL